MPANLTPEYFKAQEKYESANTREEKICALEEMIRACPKHKGTEKLLAQLKRKLAKLRKESTATKAKVKPKFTLKKEGAARISIMGVANSGKSSLLRVLTNAKPEVADYPYTTKEPVAGMFHYKEVPIQVLEIPSNFEYVNFARESELICFLLDLTLDIKEQKSQLVKVCEDFGIKINKERPKIEIKRVPSGGIEVQGRKHLKFDESLFKEILIEHGIHNAVVTLYEDVDPERLYEALNESLVYVKAVWVGNKSDIAKVGYEGIKISTTSLEGIEELKELLYQNLDIIRVFTRSKGEIMHPPIALKRGSTVRDVAERVHKDFLKNFKYARIWGPSAKFDGATVGLEHVLQDGDVVEIYAKK